MKEFQSFVFAISVAIALPVHAGVLDDVTGNTDNSGSVSGSAVSSGDGKKTASSGSNGLNRCDKNYGRLAIEESPMNQQTMFAFSRIGLASFSAIPLARHAAMQSGCFTLVDRGASFAMGEREREISGEMGGSKNRKTSTVRWALKVEVPQPTTSTGGAGGVGALARLIPGAGLWGAAAGAVAGSVSFSEAQVMLTVVDLETSEIVASVTGVGKSSDFGVGAAFLSSSSGGAGLGAGGASSQTPAMKVVAAGFVDAFNQLIPLMDKLAAITPTPAVPSAK